MILMKMGIISSKDAIWCQPLIAIIAVMDFTIRSCLRERTRLQSGASWGQLLPANESLGFWGFQGQIHRHGESLKVRLFLWTLKFPETLSPMTLAGPFQDLCYPNFAQEQQWTTLIAEVPCIQCVSQSTRWR